MAMKSVDILGQTPERYEQRKSKWLTVEVHQEDRKDDFVDRDRRRKLYMYDQSVIVSLLDEDFQIAIGAQQETSSEPFPMQDFTARASISKTTSKLKPKPKLTDVCSKRSQTSSSSKTKQSLQKLRREISHHERIKKNRNRRL